MDFHIRLARNDEREKISVFQIDNHMRASVTNEEERISQIADLPNDFPHFYDQKLFDNFMNWIAEDSNQQIVGCVSLDNRDPKLMYLHNFSVSPNVRRQGLGGRLLTTALECADNNKGEKILLHTLRDRMDDAIRLYKKHGFILEEEIISGPYIVHIYVREKPL